MKNQGLGDHKRSLWDVEFLPSVAELLLAVFLEFDTLTLALLAEVLYCLVQDAIKLFKFLGRFTALEIDRGFSSHLVPFFSVFLLQLLCVDGFDLIQGLAIGPTILEIALRCPRPREEAVGSGSQAFLDHALQQQVRRHLHLAHFTLCCLAGLLLCLKETGVQLLVDKSDLICHSISFFYYELLQKGTNFDH